MSKATSLNNIERVDPNVSQQIDNVLAEIESAKHNQMPPQQVQQQPQVIQQMPPMQGQQLPPPQQIPPTQQFPEMIPQQQHTQPPPQQYIPQMPREYTQNMMQSNKDGILGFLSSFLIIGDELKWMGILTFLFIIINLQQSINFIGNYFSFTITEIGNSTVLGSLIRGIILSFVFVLVNKFI